MGIFWCKKGASKLTIIIACCLGVAIILGGGIWGITALRSDPLARQLDLGHKYLEEGNYQQAILAFEEAIEIEPMSIEARLGLAKVYVAMDDEDGAENILKEAKGIDPSRSEPYLALAEIYLDQGREQDAVDTYLQAIAKVPANPDAYLGLAQLYLDLDMPHAALAVLESFPSIHSEIESLFEEITRVASVELDREKLWLMTGEIWTLRAVIEPVTAREQGIEWSSNNTKVAEVSPEGVVTAKAEGTAVITATTVDGDKTASVEVEIEGDSLGRSGNTVGNIVNSGFAATDGTWIYFRSNKLLQAISRMLPDGTQEETVHRRSGDHINVVDSWVYYINVYWRLCRVRVDGSDHEVLSGDYVWSVAVVDDWVYYINHSQGGRIYRMRLDGSDQQQLNEDESSRDMNVAGAWIYYRIRGSIVRIRTDGTMREVVIEERAQYLNVVNGWIYYVNPREGDTVYRVRTDGSGREQLNNDRSSYLNKANGWIYYVNQDDGNTIYRIRTDGSGREKINTDRSTDINVLGDWVYFINRDEGRDLYRVRTDGSGRERLP